MNACSLTIKWILTMSLNLLIILWIMNMEDWNTSIIFWVWGLPQILLLISVLFSFPSSDSQRFLGGRYEHLFLTPLYFPVLVVAFLGTIFVVVYGLTQWLFYVTSRIVLPFIGLVFFPKESLLMFYRKSKRHEW